MFDKEPASCELADFADTIGHPATGQPSKLLADHTTFGIGGSAKHLVRASSEAELIEAVRQADADGEKLLVLSGGSNILISDAGFDGTVVLVDSHGLQAEQSSCGGAFVTVQAGERWDDFVQYAIVHDWAGIEALSGIPGLVGATPVQNVGAYGQEVAQTIARVRCWDRQLNELHTFTNDQLGFGYRDSILKRSRAADQATGRYVVLTVSFHFQLASLSEPVRYQQLANTLGTQLGARVPAKQLRECVLELRRSKGMVVDPADPDTRSAGSFFTNPIISAEQAANLPAEAPQFAQPDGTVKTSAAWLIDHAGCPKGFPGSGAARLSSKHVLALTNHDQASADQIVELARLVRGKVQERFGIGLVPEPVLVGLVI